jgi:hypothetical protein
MIIGQRGLTGQILTIQPRGQQFPTLIAPHTGIVVAIPRSVPDQSPR